LFTRTGALHSDPRWRDVHAPCGGTAQMGQGELSIVDAKLRVDGLSNLRIADGSIVPRITTGNSHAPCVIIGERMAEILKD
jgi:choline dehydrogenase